MNNQISHPVVRRHLGLLISAMIFFSTVVHAHLISINPITPFPESVSAGSINNASFKVTNISAHVNVTVIDQSNFSASSGLSITSSTCGSILRPNQSCIINMSLQVVNGGRVIQGELKEWAKPTADAVKYPFQVFVSQGLPNITLKPVTNGGLPALREPIIATSNGNWLIVSGSLGNFHDFNLNFITDIYVYNPVTKQLYSQSMGSLPLDVQNQLQSSDPEFLHDGDTLYIIGGFYTDNNTNWTTLNTITSINVPGMMNAIINNAPIAPFVHFIAGTPNFNVTGGQLGKIGPYFYLAYGQDCEGNYCATSQTYTDSIYQFTMNPSLSTPPTIITSITHPDSDNSGWRRRDYNLVPLKLGQTDMLFAMGGPFTQDTALVWTNGILFNELIQANNSFINQQANQYSDGVFSMYSSKMNASYAVSMSGLSNLYWSPGGLIFDNTTPYGNILDLISVDANSHVHEFANLAPLCSGQPLQNCLYMGLSANFVRVDEFYDERGILLLDTLPQNSPTLVGYLYGGLVSTVQQPFGGPNQVSNQVYEIYVTPSTTDTINWQNITNLFPGN